jgi:hypothetical protein
MAAKKILFLVGDFAEAPSCRLAGSPSGRCLPKNAHSLPEDAVD